ncbi:preprotein translocase subunit SecY [bacterium]|nr:preprotein translocase subunit SecY [bacterium]MBL7995317.1 preprotein translocase subunit SecY [bacterium]
MLQTFANVFKIPELRRRVMFTLGILLIERITAHIPAPGINSLALGQYFKQAENTLLSFYDLFAGGGLSQATIAALGIMPYISASIILQLLGTTIPYLQKLQKEGDEGRKKINQMTRYGTVALSAVQALGVATWLCSLSVVVGNQEVKVVPDQGAMFFLLTMVTMTTCTMFIMWLGEQITERGIGNGISLIITIGILARFPSAIMDEVRQIVSGNRNIMIEIVLIAILLVIVAAIIFITQGIRKIPVQYARRVIGRKVYGGQSTHIPMRINIAGVMPIIFAQSIMFVPNTIATFFPGAVSDFVTQHFSIDSIFYNFIFLIIIVFFTYFYTAIAMNPVEVADNLKKQGAFIPGIRPGKKTSDFIDNILTRVTLPSAIFLGLIAILPFFVKNATDVSYSFASFFGGTSLLIIVGVALDTIQQIESHLVMRHYDGFLKTGKIRGRRG